MNLTVTPKNQTFGTGLRPHKISGADLEALRLVSGVPHFLKNNPTPREQNLALENLQAFLGGIQSNKAFKGMSMESRINAIREAIDTRIEALKPTAHIAKGDKTLGTHTPPKENEMSIEDIAREQLEIALRNGMGRSHSAYNKES